MLNRFGEKFQSTGIDVRPSEFDELNVLDAFLADHVKPNKICNVQCMLLWSEWVRSYRRKTLGFPDLIHEKEFNAVITGKYGIEVTMYDPWGAVYPGIKFVP